MSLLEQIEDLSRRVKAELGEIGSPDQVEKFRSKYLSRKGEIAALFKGMGAAPPVQRPLAGKALQELREEAQKRIDEISTSLEDKIAVEPKIDLTMPGIPSRMGGLHPLTQIEREMISVFKRMGFSVERGPEVETTEYNFDMLNTPEWHPARNETDTFYIEDNLVLRTETSPVQIRTMLKKTPPVRIIAPGRVYRNDKPDATHSPMFNQVEGLYVDKRVTMAELKGTLLEFYRALFGRETKIRFRPHYFPFTEPSAEVDVSCFFCRMKGCRVCKNSGWLEMGGSGMVHPNVFRAVCVKRGDDAYNPEKISGYAFGLGIERIAMLKFDVKDIRMFYENDLRFLEQF